MATYDRERERLEQEHAGKFVLIHGEEVISMYDTYEAAADEGLRRFGTDLFLIRRVGASELWRAPRKGGDLSVVGRRLRDIRDAIASDLGGDDQLSEAQQQLIRHAATLAIHCEQLESDMACGVGADMDAYGTMNVLRRVLNELGLKRVPKDITQLAEYLAAKAEAKSHDD